MADSGPDGIVRFLFSNHGVRGELVRIGQPGGAFLHPDYAAGVKQLLLELCAAAELVAVTLKDGSEIMLQLRGGGNAPLAYALVNVRADLSFYGSARAGSGNLGAAGAGLRALIGTDGILSLTIFPREGAKWQGIVSSDADSAGAALEGYFRDSQQLPTRLFIYADADRGLAGGIMLQIIPEVDGNLESLEHLALLTRTLTAEELFTHSAAVILARLYAREEIRVFPAREIGFRCVCSRERCLSALAGLKEPELRELCRDGNGTTMVCHHCLRQYHFGREELERMYLRNNQ